MAAATMPLANTSNRLRRKLGALRRLPVGCCPIVAAGTRPRTPFSPSPERLRTMIAPRQRFTRPCQPGAESAAEHARFGSIGPARHRGSLNEKLRFSAFHHPEDTY